MAQRTIHYLLGELLLAELPADAARFRFGNLLPDAYEHGVHGLRAHTHYTRAEGGVTFSDFEAFRRDFADRVPGDALYLGYYLHLA